MSESMPESSWSKYGDALREGLIKRAGTLHLPSERVNEMVQRNLLEGLIEAGMAEESYGRAERLRTAEQGKRLFDNLQLRPKNLRLGNQDQFFHVHISANTVLNPVELVVIHEYPGCVVERFDNNQPKPTAGTHVVIQFNDREYGLFAFDFDPAIVSADDN